MATITINLKAKMTKAEHDAADRLLAAAISNDPEAVNRYLKKPIIKELIDRGALKFKRRTVLAFEGEEFNLET